MAWVTGRLKARQGMVRGLVRVSRYGLGLGSRVGLSVGVCGLGLWLEVGFAFGAQV